MSAGPVVRWRGFKEIDLMNFPPVIQHNEFVFSWSTRGNEPANR